MAAVFIIIPTALYTGGNLSLAAPYSTGNIYHNLSVSTESKVHASVQLHPSSRPCLATVRMRRSHLCREGFKERNGTMRSPSSGPLHGTLCKSFSALPMLLDFIRADNGSRRALELPPRTCHLHRWISLWYNHSAIKQTCCRYSTPPQGHSLRLQ